MKYFQKTYLKKLTNDIPAILFYWLIAGIAIFIVGGLWHFFIGWFFDFEYILAVQNSGTVFSIIAIIWVMKVFFKDVYGVFANSVKNFLKKSSAAFLSIFAVIISYLLVIVLFKHLGNINLSINTISYSNEANFLLKLVLVQIIIVPAEEIIFRGFLLNACIKKTGDVLFSILVSSAIFSIGHIHYGSLFSFVMAFWVGIMAATLFLYYKSIYPPIFLHLGWNFSNNFFLVNENPLIKIEFSGFLSPDLIRQFILLALSILLFAMLKKKILSNIFQSNPLIQQNLIFNKN